MTIINEAVCVFGSVARASHDDQSDKDVLVVSSRESDSQHTISTWTAHGWNVSFFTWERLSELSSKGALFIQHLKQDAQLIADPNGSLNRILEAFIPDDDYLAELEKSKQLVRCLERPAQSIWQAKFQCDVLYVFVRNAGILEAASQKMFEFDYYKIVQKIGQSHDLLPEELKTLHCLRAIKAAYRSRSNIDLDCFKIACSAKSIVAEIFNINFCSISNFSNARLFDLPYATLRDIEARLLAIEEPHKLDLLANELDIKTLWVQITKPQPYNSIKQLLASDTIESINQTISKFSIDRNGNSDFPSGQPFGNLGHPGHLGQYRP